MKSVEIEALVRFNGHNPGEVFEADEADAKKWIKDRFAAKPGEPAGAPEEKQVDAPPKDKMKKGPEKAK